LRILSGLLAVTLALGPVAAQAQPCMNPAEKAAFDVRALQTQLMVAALNCRDERHDDKFNQFISRFQRDLTGYSTNLRSWFRRAHGGGSERELNSYITDLANMQSQYSSRQGSAYCARVAPLFQQALALNSARELPVLAGQQSLPQPLNVTACDVRAATNAPGAPVRR